jgi:hypothetical protein
MIPPWWFIVLGVVASLLYTGFCFSIFGESVAGKVWPWRIHQAWFNFLGAASGWAFTWALIVSQSDGFHVDGWTILLFLFAFIGVTGHMPRTVMGLVLAPFDLIGKLSKGSSH